MFPTEVDVTHDAGDTDYAADVILTDETGCRLVVSLTQDMLVALWRGLESPRTIDSEGTEEVMV